MNIISVDMGTSSVRACLVDPNLQIKHQASRNIQLNTNAGGKAEQDVEHVLAQTLVCIQETLDWAEAQSQPIAAISFSSASASLVCLDEEYNPICPALTYADLRGSSESQWLIETYGRDAFAHTAAPVHASYWLPKLLWLKHQGLENFSKLYYCTIKDLLIYRLTGKFVMDASNAGAVGMMDARELAWDQTSLEIAGIKPSQLPVIQPTTTLLDLQSNLASLTLNHKQAPKIVLGAMDGVLASLGVGAYQFDQVTTSLGSSGACRIAAHGPLIDQADQRIWSYPLTQDLWICGGATNNGGLVTQWLAKNFSNKGGSAESAYYEMLAAASQISPGANGLLFLPYLFGERAPIYNEKARGVFFGLHSGHHRGHFARAGLEGILYGLYSIYEILEGYTENLQEIRATGGYLQSQMMLQMQADIFGKTILVPSEFEGSVIGAAALAQKALGQINSFQALEDDFKIKARYNPDETKHESYRENYSRFKKLYERLAPIF